MKPPHFPRAFIIVIFILVVLTLLAGSWHAFGVVRAASFLAPTVTPIMTEVTGAALTLAPPAAPVLVSADTTGIIALAIVIVVIVLIGAILGERKPQEKKISPK